MAVEVKPKVQPGGRKSVHLDTVDALRSLIVERFGGDGIDVWVCEVDSLDGTDQTSLEVMDELGYTGCQELYIPANSAEVELVYRGMSTSLRFMLPVHPLRVLGCIRDAIAELVQAVP